MAGRAFLHPAAGSWRDPGAGGPFPLLPHPQPAALRTPLLRDAVWSSNPRVGGVEILRSQKKEPGSPSLPCFPLGVGPFLLPLQGTQNRASMSVQPGAAEGSCPRNASPTHAQHVPRWLFEQSLLPFFSNSFIPSATENQCVFSVRSPGLKLSVP